MLDPACIFCRIADGSAPADIIYQNDEVICFFPREMEVVGRTLIIPKEHFVDIYDIPDAILAELMRVARILAHHYRQRIDASGVNILHASGKSAQQSVCHFHLHVLPRFDGDGLDTWPSLPKPDISRDLLWERLRME